MAGENEGTVGGGGGWVRGGGAGGGERWALVAAFGAVWFIWGSTYLAIAWAVESLPPFLMIGVRCLLAGSVLYLWGRHRGGAAATLEDWRRAGATGFLLFVSGQAALAWAETRIPSGTASLLVATEPLFIALLGWRGGGRGVDAPGRPSAGALGALVAGLLGVAVLTGPGAVSGAVDPLGAAAALLASLSWSLGILRAGGRPGMGAAQAAGMQLLAAGAVLMAASVVSGEAGGIRPDAISVRSLAAFAYLVVFGSIVTFGAYIWLLRRVGPARISTHAYVNPLVAVALGSLLNHEPVTASLIGATVLILGSVAALLAPPRRRGEVVRIPGETRPHADAPQLHRGCLDPIPGD